MRDVEPKKCETFPNYNEPETRDLLKKWNESINAVVAGAPNQCCPGFLVSPGR